VDDSHSGTDSYAYVEPLLTEKASELLVISPYIGHGYANLLVELGRRKRVRVITSGSAEWLEGYARRHSWSVLFSHIKAMGAILLVCLALAYLKAYRLALAAAGVFFLTLCVGYLKFSSTKRSDIKVKVVRSAFIHEKVYISDSRAVVGSANLTNPGMHKNIEHVQAITERERVDELRVHFEELWKRY
jgi:phosphatidylserine/phosphatidylglycerophosphate/cardiolipin synthase-like enzyme